MNHATKTILSSILFSSCASLATAEETFLSGATIHFQKRKGIVSENLQVFKDSGLQSTRAGIWWNVWEKQKGVYKAPPEYSMYTEYLEKAPSYGIIPLQTLVCGNPIYERGYPKSPETINAFAKFCSYIASQYKGHTKFYQIWNEWDGGCGVPEQFKGQGDAVSYVKMLEAVYAGMKEVDPSLTIIANSVCTGEKFLEETLKAGVLKSCDGIAFHAYLFGSNGDSRKPEAYAARIAKISELLKKYNNGKEFPIYLTETGWPNYTKRGGSTESETADYIVRTYLLIKTIPAVKGLWWYDFQDDGLDPEYSEDNFGIVRTDLTPKEAYYAVRSIAEIIKYGKFVEKMKSGNEGLVALKFKMPDGRYVISAWNTLNNVNLSVTLKSSKDLPGTTQNFVAGFAPLERSWGMRQWTSSVTAPFLPDRFQFTAKSRPYIIIGNLADVSIEKVESISFPEIQKLKPSFVIPETIGTAYPSSKAVALTSFSAAQNYRSLLPSPLGDRTKFDASFRVSWEKDALILQVEVLDEKFCQNEDISSMWRGDSVQVAFQSLDKKSDLQISSEYVLGLTGSGPRVFRESSQIRLPSGAAESVSLDVKQEQNKTVYLARFPLSELGFKKLEPGMMFAFSILVNANDGTGRKGYLHWGDGIGNAKDPSNYNCIRIEE